MKLTQLFYFQSVCLYGSITKAAEAIHISQPSISNAIHELEVYYGVNFFNRVKKRLILTKEGELFLEHANDILDRVDKLERLMHDCGGDNARIVLGVPPMIGAILFPAMFNAFCSRNPKINLEIREYGSLHTRQLVDEGQVDIAFVIMQKESDSRFQSLPLLQTQLLFCVVLGHELAGEESIAIEQLATQPLILMKADSLQKEFISNRFREVGVEANILLYSSQLTTIKNFIAQGNVGAFLFRELVQADKELIGIPLDPPIEFSIGLIWKESRLNSAVTDFIGFAEEYFSKTSWTKE